MEDPVSKKDTLLIVSRAATLYLLCWALSDLTYLPGGAIMLSRHGSDSLWVYELTNLVFRLARIAALFAAAAWFYKCGPRVAAYFLSEGKQAGSTDGPRA
jgi:hypothetical protein